MGAARAPGPAALVASSLVVIAVAAVFDVLAAARPDHTLSLVLVAAAVGAARLRGLFSLVNLAIVAQPGGPWGR